MDNVLQPDEQLLATYRTNLRHLLDQAAKFGGEAMAPVALMHQLRDTRSDIASLKQRIRDRGGSIADDPGDFALVQSDALSAEGLAGVWPDKPLAGIDSSIHMSDSANISGGNFASGNSGSVTQHTVTHGINLGGAHIGEMRDVVHQTTTNQTTVHHHHRARLLVYPAITLVVLITLGAVVSGLAFMGVNLFGVRQTFIDRGIISEFPGAQEGETLLVIATFFRTEGVNDTDVQNEIRRAVEAQASSLGLTNLRVEVASTRLQADDQAGAETLGNRYNAAMVIWGADTNIRITVNFLNRHQPDFDAAQVKINETARSQMANPSAYASFVTTDLPAQLSFLALFAVAQTYHNDKHYEDALHILESAIAGLTPATAESPGVSSAYFGIGWLHQILGHPPSQAIDAYTHVLRLDATSDGAYNNRGNAYADVGDFPAARADFDQVITLDPTDWTPYFNRGNAFQSEKNVIAALDDYAQAMSLNPTFTGTYINRGMLYSEQGNFSAALEDFNTAIALDSDLAMAYYNRGVVYHNQKNLQAALDDYNQALLLNPNYAKAYHNRGLVYHEQGDLQAALADFNQTLALSPTAEVYDNRGNVYHDQQAFPQALADYDRAIALDPRFVKAYFDHGLLKDDQGDLQSALVDYTQAIDLDPSYKDAYLNRGTIYGALGNLSAAVADFDQAIILNPTDRNAYFNRGITHNDQGEHAAALADFNQAIKLDPDFAQAFYQRGNTYFDQRNFVDALADYSRAIDLNPAYTQAYLSRASVQYYQKNFTAALADLDQAIALDPEDATAYGYRGTIHFDLGHPSSDWAADLQKAVALNPKDAESFNQLCWFYALEGQPSTALPSCLQAVTLDPSPNYRDSRGVVYASLGKYPEAIADFQAFVTWAEQQEPTDDLQSQVEVRQSWIVTLQAGQNPITPGVLKELRAP
jgi:tetratricopeptide (TPR) repeat protein